LLLRNSERWVEQDNYYFLWRKTKTFFCDRRNAPLLNHIHLQWTWTTLAV